MISVSLHLTFIVFHENKSKLIDEAGDIHVHFAIIFLFASTAFLVLPHDITLNAYEDTFIKKNNIGRHGRYGGLTG